MIKNIILVGVGGQGILLAARIVAAAAVRAGFDVTTNEIHGMAQRGGSVTAQIRYGEEVYSPLILEGTADVLGALEAVEALRYASSLRPGALAVVSRQAIIPVTVSSGQAKYPEDIGDRLQVTFQRLKYLDCTGLAEEKFGNGRVANLILLGALSNGLDLPGEAWHGAIGECVKPCFVELNRNAFEYGRTL